MSTLNGSFKMYDNLAMQFPKYNNLTMQLQKYNNIAPSFNPLSDALTSSLNQISSAIKNAVRPVAFDNLYASVQIPKELFSQSFKLYEKLSLPSRELSAVISSINKQNLAASIESLNSVNEISKKLYTQLSVPMVYSFSPAAHSVRDQMIDRMTGAFTPSFTSFSQDVCGLSPDDFEVVQADDDYVELSESMSRIIGNITDKLGVLRYISENKAQIKDFLYKFVLIPLLLTAVQVGFNVHANQQQSHALETYHQEKMQKLEKIYEEERQQTQYLKEIAENRRD